MRLRLKEDPKEWRKTAWLTVMGVAIFSSLLRWRHVLGNRSWAIVLVAAAVAAVCAWSSPQLFRGYYRVSMRLGFYTSLVAGRIVLGLFFILFLTPLGLILRLSGKDLLRLKRQKDARSYWNEHGEKRPMTRLF